MKKHEDFEVGDLIELNKIYNDDCLEGMKLIPDGSVIEILLIIFTPVIFLISFVYMVVSIINYVSPILSLMQSLTGN